MITWLRKIISIINRVGGRLTYQRTKIELIFITSLKITIIHPNAFSVFLQKSKISLLWSSSFSRFSLVHDVMANTSVRSSEVLVSSSNLHLVFGSMLVFRNKAIKLDNFNICFMSQLT